MTWQRIGLYYTLAAVLGAYFFLFEWQPNKRPGLVDPTAPVVVQQSHFLPGSREDIQEIVLKQGDVTILCRRDGQRWIVSRASWPRYFFGSYSRAWSKT